MNNLEPTDHGIRIPPPHPACLSEAEFLRECSLKQTRRGGPGGQHRNKVSTAIVITHEPTGIIAEASERRSQADNRKVAIRRLRETLAIVVRTQATGDKSMIDRSPYLGYRLRLSEGNWDRPAVLAILLDDISLAAGSLQDVAGSWGSSTSAVVRFLKEFPEALRWVNTLRAGHNFSPLK